MTIACTCPCGHTTIAFSGEPVLRVHCHCRICQKVYDADHADFVMLSARQIARPQASDIRYAKHRPPPAVRRGTCPNCEHPVVAWMPLAPFLGLAFVPTANLPAGVKLPEPALHSFYHRRVKHVQDDVPKVAGYWASQWAVVRRFFTAWWLRGSRRG